MPTLTPNPYNGCIFWARPTDVRGSAGTMRWCHEAGGLRRALMEAYLVFNPVTLERNPGVESICQRLVADGVKVGMHTLLEYCVDGCTALYPYRRLSDSGNPIRNSANTGFLLTQEGVERYAEICAEHALAIGATWSYVDGLEDRGGTLTPRLFWQPEGKRVLDPGPPELYVWIDTNGEEWHEQHPTKGPEWCIANELQTTDIWQAALLAAGVTQNTPQGGSAGKDIESTAGRQNSLIVESWTDYYQNEIPFLTRLQQNLDMFGTPGTLGFADVYGVVGSIPLFQPGVLFPITFPDFQVALDACLEHNAALFVYLWPHLFPANIESWLAAIKQMEYARLGISDDDVLPEPDPVEDGVIDDTPSLLGKGMDWLSEQRHAHMAHDVRYRRGTNALILKATPARLSDEKLAMVANSELMLETEVLDWLFRAQDLGAFGLPVAGDIIEDGLNRYEVRPLSGESAWRYSNARRKTIRVHTKRVIP